MRPQGRQRGWAGRRRTGPAPPRPGVHKREGSLSLGHPRNPAAQPVSVGPLGRTPRARPSGTRPWEALTYRSTCSPAPIHYLSPVPGTEGKKKVPRLNPQGPSRKGRTLVSSTELSSVPFPFPSRLPLKSRPGKNTPASLTPVLSSRRPPPLGSRPREGRPAPSLGTILSPPLGLLNTSSIPFTRIPVIHMPSPSPILSSLPISPQ